MHAWKPRRLTADDVKKRVGEWASGMGYWPITEIGGVVDGRIDVLLVPTRLDCPMFKGMGAVADYWTDRLGLAGVEVKVDKSDYKNGATNGQFERYSKTLCGLYIAGPPDVVVAKNVPPEYGVLTLGTKPFKDGELPHIVCRRHPRWQRCQLERDGMWRVIWKVMEDVRRERRTEREEAEELERKIRQNAGNAIWKAVKAASIGLSTRHLDRRAREWEILWSDSRR